MLKIIKGTFIKRLVFISKSSPDTNHAEIMKMITHSRQNNPKNDITSAMIWDGNFFLQALEGDTQNVDTLFEKIKRDKRHYNICVICDEQIDKRCIDDWYVSYINSSKVVEKIVYKAIGEKELSYEVINDKNALKLLKELIQYF